MSVRAMTWAWSISVGDGTDKAVLVALADHADEANSCWPSIDHLVSKTEFSERTIRRAIRSLEEAGWISTQGGVGRGHTSRYILHLERTEKGSESPVSGKGDTETAFVKGVRESDKRGQRVRKGVRESIKGVTVAPEPLRTPIEPSGNPKTRVRAVEEEPSLPEWLPPEAWAEWCAYRTAKCRKSWTQLAAKKSLQTLSKLRDGGNDPVEVIDQAIASGWTGLFPVKGATAAKSNSRSWIYDNDDPLWRRPQ